jgi:hypothetical protein
MSKWESIGQSDEWYTPAYIFNALNTTFDIDVAAPECRKYCCTPAKEFITSDSLIRIWSGFVWMNPPFGGRNGIVPWLNKLAVHNNGIALTPDRTSAPWWQNAAKKSSAIMFINGKVKFVKPDGSTGDSPSTGTTLFAYGYKAKLALYQAEANGLGILLQQR